MNSESEKWSKPSPSKPFTLRLTDDERRELERQAGSKPLGSHIRSTLLGESAKRQRSGRRPVKDQATLAQLLGMFGQSDVAARLTALSKAIESGALVVDDDTIEAIQSACAEVHAMHMLLMRALGFQVEEPESVSSSFNRAASESEVSS